MSSVLAGIERFLGAAGFDRAPWLAVAFAGGIAAWFGLPDPRQWGAWIAGWLGIAALVQAAFAQDGRFPYLRQSIAALALMLAAGCGTVWMKSALVGADPIARPVVASVEATVIAREERPAQGRVRLVVATRDPLAGRPIRARLNLDLAQDRPALVTGARISARVRLMPPAPPMLPGGYDFARSAWFAGLSATGSVLGEITVLSPATERPGLERAQAALSRHVRENLSGSAGGIAAALASGDRGAILPVDDQAMRDAGLAHLLSISGLHVSALVGAVYLLALWVGALWPWLALRVRLPLMAAGIAALAGIGYTLLTGAEVPTVRSCIGAMLVLGALALGREPLSMRMLATAALFVMVFWPEAVVGPSFQMSFAAVIAIVALHGSAPVRAFLAPREEGPMGRLLRHGAMLLLTGVVIELALMPIGLFHFHRAGVYGAVANLVAIPLTTMVTMPLIALALVLDLAGAGAPAWWLAGLSIDLIIALAHTVTDQPGAVTRLPAMGRAEIALCVAGGLWLALWRGRARLLGLVPLAAGALTIAWLQPPDILVSGDGRHVGITGAAGDGNLLVLRPGRGSEPGFAGETLAELAGMRGRALPLAEWSGARCNRDFCVVLLDRGGRTWRLLIARGDDIVPERALAAACERVDIVIAHRWLPSSCRPRWLRADRATLVRSGGMTIDLAKRQIRTVAQTQGQHGWWRQPPERKLRADPNGIEQPLATDHGVSGSRLDAKAPERPAPMPGQQLPGEQE